ncbi:PA1571 family protein [Pseudomonas sp. NPDC090202]|uniref:PA1571 family protein n=1 Tax=unclassified Pseudomonas TaxID=196821 RepID=UPI0038150D42
MSLQNSGSHEPVVRPQPELQLGGAILDKDGKEILITEEMVQSACQECEKYWVKPEKQE